MFFFSSTPTAEGLGRALGRIRCATVAARDCAFCFDERVQLRMRAVCACLTHQLVFARVRGRSFAIGNEADDVTKQLAPGSHVFVLCGDAASASLKGSAVFCPCEHMTKML